jgi:hypothetical protein
MSLTRVRCVRHCAISLAQTRSILHENGVSKRGTVHAPFACMKSTLPRAKKLAAPFVVTVATAVSIASVGCLGSVSGAGNNPKACPTEIPSSGSSCDEFGLECTYGIDQCNNQPRKAICNAPGTWSQLIASCNPPPPRKTCPAAAPTLGESCAAFPVGQSCDYARSQICTATDVPLVCGANGTWTIASVPPNARQCPAMPTVGTACGGNCPTMPGDGCVYPLVGDPNCPPPSFLCNEGKWEALISSCNPPPPVLDAGSEDSAPPMP